MNRKNKRRIIWVRGEPVDLLFRNRKPIVITPISNPVLRLDDLLRFKKAQP
jgi:hypothetical protein